MNCKMLRELIKINKVTLKNFTCDIICEQTPLKIFWKYFAILTNAFCKLSFSQAHARIFYNNIFGKAFLHFYQE
jgi:hypothetical protein